MKIFLSTFFHEKKMITILGFSRTGIDLDSDMMDWKPTGMRYTVETNTKTSEDNAEVLERARKSTHPKSTPSSSPMSSWILIQN